MFNKEMDDDPYHRYYSWEHCYSYFHKLRSNRNEGSLDNATLHLAFYLASWGMYRGSSNLLQKDYRVHTRIVNEIMEEKYSRLWNLDFDILDPEGPEVSLLFKIEEALESLYPELQVSPTDTLITKVLLGTFGCIPAYDNLFIKGVTYWNQELPAGFHPKFPARYGKRSYLGVITFYRENKSEILETQRIIAKRGIEYPVMKLIDMYFWNLGYQLLPKQPSIHASPN
jgi:hypothetical protein